MTPAETEYRRPGAEITFEPPGPQDGAALWRLARDSQALDLNSPYSYLLWCRDFAATSVVARRADGRPVGFVTGYRRPERPEALMIWQVAVDDACRGQGLAGRLLDHLVERLRPEGVRALETTVTPDNVASRRLFASFAERHGARLERVVLFPEHAFPDDSGEPHLAEELHRIEPLDAAPAAEPAGVGASGSRKAA